MGTCLGVILVLSTFYNIYRGEITVSYSSAESELAKNVSQRPWYYVSRAERPVYFWVLVAGEFLVALILFSGVLGF